MNGYMKNKENIKNTFSNIRPSDECIERVFDMTVDKKANKSLILKKMASVALVFALLIGGGFGTNAVIQNVRTNKSLGVMVAYADEFMKVKSGSKQPVFKSLYFAPADDKEKCALQRAKAEKEYEKNREIYEKLATNNEEASISGVGIYDIYDSQGNAVTKLYTTGFGFFAVNKTDYENVKSFTVENESEDGYLQFEWSGTADLLQAVNEDNVNEENPYEDFINHKFTLTGDELRESQNSDYNKYGYICEWNATPEIFEEYDEKYANGFDAASIKDKITFTFEYNDGTTESASINIGFNSDGQMIVS